MEDDERERMMESHPIREKTYRLYTPMLERTYEIVRDRVWTRRTGIFFYGPPRLGKTTCAEEVCAALIEEFPKIYVCMLSARGTLRPSDSHMFRLYLEAVDHKMAFRTDSRRLFNNTKTDILMNVGIRGGSQFVLIIDEMQLLNDTDLEQLLVLHNALGKDKVKMTTVAFAQPEIKHKVTALLTKGQRQIIARFLSEPVAFVGCTDLRGFEKLLIGYDGNSEFPEGSGWSYTQFFFPVAFSNGFRLQNYGKKIWASLLSSMEEEKQNGIPMEHVCLTIEYILLALRTEDCSSFILSDENINDAVEASNLKYFSTLMSSSVS